jgi:hypothetical protein
VEYGVTGFDIGVCGIKRTDSEKGDEERAIGGRFFHGIFSAWPLKTKKGVQRYAPTNVTLVVGQLNFAGHVSVMPAQASI